MRAVTPKHARSLGGEPIRAVTSRAVALHDPAGSGAAKYGFSTTFETFPAAGARTYVVRQGDTLSSIAKGQLGRAGDWVKLYRWNRHLIHDPDLIYIGQELLIRE
ncbi:LysM peptidoglycan-binding domain-containing protein [Paenibacillus sp. S-38]|uniref:LysM peptidoglycan-binding domain-containing protein n=1 Tax=Paenibacillus sp. S-38 TaxID=3416710 RepID=UPI003CEB3179